MDSEQIITMHHEVIVEKLLKLAKKSYEKYLFYSEEIQHISLETNEYWKAASKIELSKFEFNDFMKQLRFIDDLTHWSDNISEGRYEFVEGYKTIFRKYKAKI